MAYFSNGRSVYKKTGFLGCGGDAVLEYSIDGQNFSAENRGRHQSFLAFWRLGLHRSDATLNTLFFGPHFEGFWHFERTFIQRCCRRGHDLSAAPFVGILLQFLGCSMMTENYVNEV